MKELIDRFFYACWQQGAASVYHTSIPAEMMLTPPDESGWFEWRLVSGTLSLQSYRAFERQFSIRLPKSFIEWHRAYFFLDGDCVMIRLPSSMPNTPLEGLKLSLDWPFANQLIFEKLYPFAEEGNDTGPLVFDARIEKEPDKFPIRVYDHDYHGDLAGLGPVIFSSFSKLFECLVYFLEQTQIQHDFECIPAFFSIDPEGAELRDAPIGLPGPL